MTSMRPLWYQLPMPRSAMSLLPRVWVVDNGHGWAVVWRAGCTVQPKREVAVAKRSTVAQTADGPSVVAAVEQFEPDERRILSDPFACLVVPDHLRVSVRACRWKPARDLFVSMSDATAPGVWGGVVCRKRYVRDQVAAAVAAGIAQLVVLGAGLDTVALSAGIPAWEVDLPENGALKRERLVAMHGSVPETVRLVTGRLGEDDVWAALLAAGVDADVPVVVVCEAVSQYLPRTAFESMVANLAPASGSRLMFSYVVSDFFDGRNLYGSGHLHSRFVDSGVWKLGLAPHSVPALLAVHGWQLVEDVGASEYEERYVRPAGRPLAVTPIERFVLARRS